MRQWASILAGLRQTSEAVYEPSAGHDDQSYAKIKNLAKFVAWGAHVRFADGDRRGAVTILLDGLKMARRLRQGTTLDALVATACEAIVMASFDDHLDQIPLAECDRARKAAEAFLASPMPVPSDASAGLEAMMGEGPGRWTMKGVDSALPAFAKTLTQLRLLRLHMRVEAYRWNHFKLPARLTDAAPREETEDPLTQETYRYEPKGLAYTITSAGFKDLGPMGLRYRRDPNLPPTDETPTGAKP